MEKLGNFVLYYGKRKINLYPPKIGKNSIKYFKKCISASMVSTGGDLISDFEKKSKIIQKANTL